MKKKIAGLLAAWLVFGPNSILMAAEVGTNDLRLSDAGPDGSVAWGVSMPAIAYNSVNNEYLVVWVGEDNTGTLVDNEAEIFGQRIDAATGLEVGTNDFRISDMGPDGNISFGANTPSVAYNPTNNEYLVVWVGDDTGQDNEDEIYGQRLDGATGAEVGTNDFRISDMGADGNANYDAVAPSVAYNSTNNEYLVVWSGDDNTGALADNEFEIYGQRINAATGAEVGTNDFRVSDMGVDGNANFDASDPRVAYNSANNEYLVVWWGDDTVPGNDNSEIFGQRLNAATGAEVGTNDFRISDLGLNDGDPAYGGFAPKIAYNSVNSEYLVVWRGVDDTGALLGSGTELFGQRLSAAGVELGTNDFRISDLGPDGDASYDVIEADVTYNSVSNEYLAVFAGDDNTGALAGDEYEVFVQRLDGSSGAEIGTNDERISDMGATDGDNSFQANDSAAAYNSTNNQYFVAWSGDDDAFGTIDNETEIFGQRLAYHGVSTPGSSADQVRVYPNPYRPSRGHTAITLSDAPANAIIRIHSLSGDLVRELTADSTGAASWDAKNMDGESVASGVYFAHIEGGGDTVKKIAIQR